MEDYGVLVGRTLVDVSQWSASVLLVDRTLPVHLEGIVAGFHPPPPPPLGLEGRAPGKPVTGRTTAVRHDIETQDARGLY